MKHFLLSISLLWIAAGNNLLHAQSAKDTATMLLRLYEDNDFINIYLKGTDNAYTNGTQINLFYKKKKKSHFFVDWIMPKAGDSSVNVYGWGITQLMYTPNDIATSDYQPDDYPYAGALFATHSLYSYNAAKKFDLQTEIELGVSGSDANADFSSPPDSLSGAYGMGTSGKKHADHKCKFYRRKAIGSL